MKKNLPASKEAGGADALGTAVHTSGLEPLGTARAEIVGDGSGAALPDIDPSNYPSGAVPLPVSRPWPRDEYSGVAGDYVRDPITGKRRPAGEPAPGPADPL